jgi:hypothetical protein
MYLETDSCQKYNLANLICAGRMKSTEKGSSAYGSFGLSMDNLLGREDSLQIVKSKIRFNRTFSSPCSGTFSREHGFLQ